MSKETLWLLKDKKGRIKGPLAEKKIHRLMDRQKLQGMEFLALYPDGHFKPLSEYTEFYDYFLKSLSSPPSKNVSEGEGASLSPSALLLQEGKDSEATRIVDPVKWKQIKKERGRKLSVPPPEDQNLKAEKTTLFLPEDEEKEAAAPPPSGGFSVWGLSRKHFVWAGVGVVLVLFFLQEPSPSSSRGVYLKTPRLNQARVSKDEVTLLIKKGLVHLLRGGAFSYLKAQDLFVQAIEGDRGNLTALAGLCFVYKELWPLAHQDLKSLKQVRFLTHRVALLNKGGEYAEFCQSTRWMIEKEYSRAETTMDQVLNRLDHIKNQEFGGPILPLLYYLKAEVLYRRGDLHSLTGYTDTVQGVLPQWIKPYLLEGESLWKQNKISAAINSYQQVLNFQPQNKEAALMMGILEMAQKQPGQGAARILQALQNKEPVSDHLTSQAYFALAGFNTQKGDRSRALKFALKAYEYNPTDPGIEKMILNLKGMQDLKHVPIKTRLLVEKGDHLTLQNKLQEAVGYYKTAFQTDKKKNGLVAVKIAKNMWKLNFFDEAVQWLKKATQADSDMVEAYVLMSRYHADQYNFSAASKILDLAFRQFTRSYEVYQGLAHLSLRRGEYKNAVQYAEVALKLSASDTASHVILSEAYRQLGKKTEALSTSAKALEIDPHEPQVQMAYGRALGGMYGSDSGSDYFQKLVSRHSTVLEYRLAWARYLIEDEKYDQAHTVLNEIIELHPRHSEAHFYMGKVLMFNEHYSQAYQFFLKSAVLSPGNPRPTFAIGLLRLKEKNLSAARKQFENVLELNPFYPKAHYYLGRTYFLRGGREGYYKAIEQARLETKINPHLTLPFILAGEAYEKLQDFLNCAEEYQKAIEWDSENPRLYIKTAGCYRQAGYLDLAVNVLKKILSMENQKTGEPDLYRELGFILEMRANYLSASGAYCNYLKLRPGAKDRKRVQKRIDQMARRTGRRIKCEYTNLRRNLSSFEE